MTPWHLVLYIGVASMSAMLYLLRKHEAWPRPDHDPIVRFGALPVRLIGMGLLLWSPPMFQYEAYLWVRILCGVAAASSAIGMLDSISHLGSSASRGQWVVGPLVIDGPYATMRHPFYFNVVMLSINASLFMVNWAALIFASILAFILYLRIPQEEADLLTHHGQRYIDYMARTPRYFPRLW